MYHLLRSIYRYLATWFYGVVSKSRFLSSVYYCFFSSAIKFEHQAVLAGKAKYFRDAKVSSSSVYLLRRNVHRIEKGLMMRPLKKVFALEYIDETVNGFCDAVVAEKYSDKASLAWGKQVLGKYFSTIDLDKRTASLKERFEKAALSLEGNVGADSKEMIPFKRDGFDAVDFTSFKKLALHRRSVRWFNEEAVPRERLEAAIEVALLSPSACNRYPFRFIVVDDPELLRTVSTMPGGTTGYADSIKCMIVIVGQLDAFFEERDRHLIYIDAGLASMSLVYALETMGLSSCCINWPDIPGKNIESVKYFNLGPYERVVMFMAVGYPDNNRLVAYSGKPSLQSKMQYFSGE